MNRKDIPIRDRIEGPVAGIEEEAARWSEILRETAPGDSRTREEFEAWRARSPEHTRAFARAQSAHALARSVADAPQMRALRGETLDRIARRGRRRAWTRRFAIAASVLVTAGLGVFLLRPEAARQAYRDARGTLAGNVYTTEIGQRSTVTLDDGSILTLNTDSRVSVHYETGLRSVTLERGQALFKVAKDGARPFVVEAGGRHVTALGTEFDVRVSERMFEVTLLEGRVKVTRERGDREAADMPLAELRPGQQFVEVAKARPQVREADVKRIVSWRRGQVVFEDERLADAVAEMNRYSRQQVVLGDERLASLRISGAFNTGDTGTFVEALVAYFPIERAPDERKGTIVLSPRQPLRG
ncbi:MAG TPA: FecR domain-containing protein [Luteimonas sp.]|nr:FecR domain-containing protein [Luteimonas sp.]